MEGDKEIFKGILEPLIVDPVSEASKSNDLRLQAPLIFLKVMSSQTQTSSPSTDTVCKFYLPFILFFTSVNNQP
jgi:hypothetical protein